MVTAHQFKLLVAMAERPGRVLSREQLQNLVKGESLEAYDRSIHVHVGRLRAVIEDDPRKPRRIITRAAPAMCSHEARMASVND